MSCRMSHMYPSDDICDVAVVVILEIPARSDHGNGTG